MPRSARAGLFGGTVSSRRLVGAAGRGRGGRAEETKPKLSLRVVLRDAAELVAARRGRLLVGLGILAVNRAAALVLPGTTKFLLDDVMQGGRRDLLPLLVAAAAGATLFQAASSFALTQVLGKAAQRSITEMRRRVQRHVGRLPVAYYDQTKAGALLSRVMTDAEGIRNLVGSGLVELVGGLLTAVLAVGILLWLSVRLTVIALAVLSLFGLVLLYAFKVLRPLFRERSKINAEVSGRLAESFSGVRVVKAYGAERREALVFTKGAHRLFRNVARTMTGFSLVGAASALLLGIIGVTMMWVGSNEVLAGRMTLGSFFSFTLYLGLLVGPVAQAVGIGTQITEAFAGLERIREIRNEMPEDEGEAARRPLPPLVGRVELEEVHFEYQPGTPVLRGVSLVAEPGTATALVGPSGAGKSTLIGLVAGFYRPTGGRILVDGHDLAEVRLVDYRAQLGVVFQDNFLFDGTVFENIAYARPEAPEEEVRRAAAIAHVDDFVARLPDGYETIVGERGVKLSGGERQRVAIARAILADPRILILDEATSSLDSESEALIQEGLARLMRGRTTFVIAHRLSTVRRADAILVLEEGRVVERGRHEELLARGGRYHALYTRQYNLEADLFLNPGEMPGGDRAEEGDGDGEGPPRPTADAGIGRLPLLPG
ncbi:MAG TPA: ABC transporter ATP-binding protein [Thermoanaerobaculia bacterium]|nr:ABC transporter ATP-binding protein [Thermoanaerobaculia bacterium]